MVQFATPEQLIKRQHVECPTCALRNAEIAAQQASQKPQIILVPQTAAFDPMPILLTIGLVGITIGGLVAMSYLLSRRR